MLLERMDEELDKLCVKGHFPSIREGGCCGYELLMCFIRFAQAHQLMEQLNYNLLFR